MGVTIHVPTPDTPAKYLQSLEHSGRPSGKLAGAWVDDFVALKRAVMLCEFCVSKFHPKSNHYVLWRRDMYSIAKCDDCKQPSRHIRTFIHESTSHEVGDPEKRRRRGRWAKG